MMFSKSLRGYLQTGFFGVLALSFSGGGLAAEPIPNPAQAAQAVFSGKMPGRTEGALTFAHFSDQHMGQNAGLPDSFRFSPELTRRALIEVATIYPRAAFAVFTGDNASLKDFDKAAAGSPVKVFGVPGNGERGTYLGPWCIVDTVRREDYPPAPWRDDRSIKEIGNSLFIFLDSALPRAHEGALSWDQMRWVHETLSRTADKHVFLFLHHGDGWMMNQDWFDDMLNWHRPRFRSIVVCTGHDHSAQNASTLRQSVGYLRAGSIQNGYYRVFHIFEDHIITYTRNSSAYAAMAAEAGGVKAATGTPPFNPLASEPIVIATGPRPAAGPV
ncbi:MAG: hypothetical protein Q8O57_08485, partial [Kiritimatiellota bacterium]|nr:hypothetical protein [Kiritimatiellota bacterium]